MKLELNIPQSQEAAIKTIITVIAKTETGNDMSVESAIANSKVMNEINEEFATRIVQWKKKIATIAKYREKEKNVENRKLNELKKAEKAAKKAQQPAVHATLRNAVKSK